MSADTVYRVLTVYDADASHATREGENLAVVLDHVINLAERAKGMIEHMVELILVTDDCGDTARAAVNSNLITTCLDTYERVCFITGSKSNTFAQAQTDKASYTSELATYSGAWVQVFDDSGTNLVDVPFSIFLAVIRANIPVHWSIAFRDPQVTKYLTNVKGLGLGSLAPYSTASKTIRDQSTDSQIVQPIQGVPQQGQQTGPWQVLHGRDANLTSGFQYEVTTWYRIYVELSLTPQLDPYTNGPNDFDSLREIQGLINNFFEGEVKLKHVVPGKDAQGNPFPAYATDIDSVNSSADMANGNAFISINAHTPGVRERLFLLTNIGETVNVQRVNA